MNSLPPYLILFDGVCNLCESSVQFVIKRDKKKRFKYGSLQGDTAQKILWENNLNPQEMNSVVFIDHGKIYTKSNAALRIAILMGGMWNVLGMFLIVPAPIRDWVYDYIAKNRYRWYGKKEKCWLPNSELEELFID